MMQPTIIEKGTEAYKKLYAVAKLLEAVSPNNATYEVEEVYFDYGLDWMWTTIVRHGHRECQILSPRDWEEIIMSGDSKAPAKDLALCAEMIRNGEYFGDRY